jgi:hypothetical protein
MHGMFSAEPDRHKREREVVPEVKDMTEAKVAVFANISVDSVMVSVAKSAVETSMVKDTEKEKANAKNVGTITVNSKAISSDKKHVTITSVDSKGKDAEDATITTANSKVKVSLLLPPIPK